MARVADLFRYPVKSLQGERIERASLTATGIPGDRAWALRDDVRGEITGGRRFPQLMTLSARLLAEPTEGDRAPPVELTDPQGERIGSTDKGVNAWLAVRLDHAASLWPLLPADAEAHYRRAAPDPEVDPETGLREMFARLPDEPLPDLSQFPRELFTYASPRGTYFDAFPLLILSTGALAELERRARAAGSQSVFDVRRFRPNVLVEGGADGFIEDAWCGQELRIGTARVRVEMRCPRCSMTTHGFADLPRDPRVMRSLVLHHGGDLGVYAQVIEPGEVRLGDAVEVI
jgi:uncharacterized protein YcbX